MTCTRGQVRVIAVIATLMLLVNILSGPVAALTVQLNTQERIAYISGYDDNTIKPDGNITRAETATIFFNLVLDDYKNTVNFDSSFGDVAQGQWYYQSVTYLANYGILSGYGDGTFLPSNSITRAEFAKVVSLLMGVSYGGEAVNPFTDLSSSHWAYGDIMACYENGYISGYPDGTFSPNGNITRAEAVTLVNRALGREGMEANGKLSFSDLTEGHWAYDAFLEAVLAGADSPENEEDTPNENNEDGPKYENLSQLEIDRRPIIDSWMTEEALHIKYNDDRYVYDSETGYWFYQGNAASRWLTGMTGNKIEASRIWKSTDGWFFDEGGYVVYIGDMNLTWPVDGADYAIRVYLYYRQFDRCTWDNYVWGVPGWME